MFRTFFLLIIIILLIPFYIDESIMKNVQIYTLKKNDFTIFNLTKNDTKQQIVNNKITSSIKKEILKKLPDNYHFLDYSYEIKNSSLYTFHRDVTSSKKFQKLKYKSYTLIIYFNKGKHLSICPNSVNSKFLIPKPQTIIGNSGQCILFNSDIVHAAAIDKTTERYCKQYKICHIDDINKLKHLQNQHIKKEENIRNLTMVDKYIRILSHKFLPLFDFNIIGKYIERRQKSYIVSFLSKTFNINFFNDT